MKKLLVLFLLTMGVCVGNAEEMKFITTLSSPVGTFAQLEAVHPLVYAEAPIVNFCNTRVGAGRMTVNGANAYVNNLVLQPSTTMGGNVPEYRIATSVLMYGGGSIKGGRLMANNVGFGSSSQPKSDVTNTLYTNDVMLQGAKTTNLTIPNKVQTTNQGSGEELEWSNIYANDYTCNDKGNCSVSGSTAYTSYLLKSKGGGSTTPPDCSVGPEGSVKAYKNCSCGGTLYAKWSKTECAYVPYDAVDVSVSCRTYYCDSGDGQHINNSGCVLEGNFSSLKVPFFVYKYDAPFVADPSTWKWKWKEQDPLEQGWTWTEQCGWPDGRWTDAKSCVHGFGLDASGAQQKTITCGDCTYNVELVSDSSDEEWGSSYCDGRAF